MPNAETSIDLGEDFAEQIKAFPISAQITIAASLAQTVLDRFPAEKRRMAMVLLAETLMANIEERESRL